MLAVDQSLIGKEACELVKSIVTGKPFCKTVRRTGELHHNAQENHLLRKCGGQGVHRPCP